MAGRAGQPARPLLDIYLGSEWVAPHTCLVDTGAQGVRLSAAWGRAAGASFPDAPTGPDVIAGGVRSQVFEARVPLTVVLDGRQVSWSPIVGFCHPWPHAFGLLGQVGFLDAFDVLFQGRDGRFECTPRV